MPCSAMLQDAEVSGQHAQIWCDGGVVYAADRPGSFNGTFLRLAPEKEASLPYFPRSFRTRARAARLLRAASS